MRLPRFAPLAALLLLVLLTRVARAADASPPPTLGWPEYLGVALAALAGIKVIVDVLLAGLRWLAPRTATTVDDMARDDLQLVHDKLDSLQRAVQGIAAQAVPKDAAGIRVVPGSGTAAMLALVLLGGLCLPQTGCAASQRESTIKAAMITLDASKEAYLVYDAHAQDQIVAHATSLEDGKAKLAAYRAKRETAVKALTVGYQAEATAALLNDDPSLATLVKAVAEVIATVKALTGGAP